jgi:hypothetical protein
MVGPVHLDLRVINEADRQRHVQLSAPRFAQQATTHPRWYHMQFCFIIS